MNFGCSSLFDCIGLVQFIPSSLVTTFGGVSYLDSIILFIKFPKIEYFPDFYVFLLSLNEYFLEFGEFYAPKSILLIFLSLNFSLIFHQVFKLVFESNLNQLASSIIFNF